MEEIRSHVVGWPALMTQEVAASYLSLDSDTFIAATTRYSIAPMLVESEKLRWRKADLDRLIRRFPYDQLLAPTERLLRLENSALEYIATKVAEKLDQGPARQSSPMVSINETAQLMGVGRSTIYRLIETGRLSKRKIGRRTLITRDSINDLLIP